MMDFLLMKDYSINFGDKNTWTDWHLVPTSRPVINPPQLKKKTIDIPGWNGSLDLSESLTGYPVFENRTGSIEFYVMNGFAQWYEIYAEVMNYLHGKKMQMILSEDPDFYYEGRFTVNNWKSDKGRSRIAIDYDVAPYKMSTTTSLTGRIWNLLYEPLGFYPQKMFKDIELEQIVLRELTLTSRHIGQAPVVPKIIANTDNTITMRYINDTLGIDVQHNLQNGDNLFPDVIMYGDSVSYFFLSQGENAKVSIDFRPGRL